MMRHQLSIHVIFLMLVAFVVMPTFAATAVAQEADGPAWLIPGASYAGIWKTEGANAAADAESQITFGYQGMDGNLVFLPEEGKLAIVYGFNPVGAPNHSDTNILATRTPDGFRWGQFDPGRNSAEVTCVVSTDGASLTCARHAMFGGREFFNSIEMTRITTEAAAAPPAQQPVAGSESAGAPPCTLNEVFAPVSGQTGRPFSEVLTNPAASESQARYLGAWQGTMNDEMVRLVIFSTNRLQYTWTSMNPGDDAQAYRTFQIDASGVLTWDSGQGITYSAVRQDDGTLKLHQTRGDGEAEGVLDACTV